MTLIFAFGIAFQLPVILTLLGHVGIVDSAYLVRMRLCYRGGGGACRYPHPA